MLKQIVAFWHHYCSPRKNIQINPVYNQMWKKFLRAGYYTGCLFLGMLVSAGAITAILLVLAFALMNIYLSAPATAGILSIIMMGLVEWTSLVTTLTGVLLVGPLIFNKTAWVFGLIPPDESYNFADAIRDARDVVIYIISTIGSWFSWWDYSGPSYQSGADSPTWESNPNTPITNNLLNTQRQPYPLDRKSPLSDIHPSPDNPALAYHSSNRVEAPLPPRPSLSMRLQK